MAGLDEAMKYGPAALKKVAHMAGLLNERGELLKRGQEPHGAAASEAVRKSALDTVIERAYGKAAQPLHHGNNEGGPLVPNVNLHGTRGFGAGAGGSGPKVSPKAGAGVRKPGD